MENNVTSNIVRRQMMLKSITGNLQNKKPSTQKIESHEKMLRHFDLKEDKDTKTKYKDIMQNSDSNTDTSKYLAENSKILNERRDSELMYIDNEITPQEEGEIKNALYKHFLFKDIEDDTM